MKRPKGIDGLVSPLSRQDAFAGRELAWGLDLLAGRLAELSGAGATAVLTAAFGLVLEAQRRGEPVAWVTLVESTFYPPDAAAGGVDLAALAVVRASDPAGAARAARELVRSGGFGLVVVDLGGDRRRAELPAPLETKLAGLAQKHGTAVVVLTEKPAHRPSLGSLVSLRAEASRETIAPLVGATGRETIEAERRPPAYEVRIRILKDKRHGPGREHREICRGPDGLR